MTHLAFRGVIFIAVEVPSAADSETIGTEERRLDGDLIKKRKVRNQRSKREHDSPGVQRGKGSI